MQAKQNQGSGLALPLALVYWGLVAYASLYPFAPWQFQGVMPWAFVAAALPKYWSGFDVVINVLGYVPLGFLLAIAWQGRAHRQRSPSIWFATLFGCALSFVLEALQTYLAPRVPSNLDWALNTLGACAGGFIAWLAEALGVLSAWFRFRERRFQTGSGFVLGMLLLWPLALLYPTPIPLGLGYGLGHWLELTTQTLSDRAESLIISLGFIVPLLMSYAVTPKLLHRVVVLALLSAAAIGVTTLSNGLSFGPDRAVVWLHSQALWALCAALGAGLLLLPTTRRLCWLFAFLCLVPQLALLSIMSPDPYFNETLSLWERGQFIRFYGATHWLGRLWPFAALLLIVSHITWPRKN